MKTWIVAALVAFSGCSSLYVQNAVEESPKAEQDKAKVAAEKSLQTPLTATGPQADVFVGVSNGFTYGLKVGLRHWINRVRAIGAEVTYENSGTVADSNNVDHDFRPLALEAKYEFAYWSKWSEEHLARPKESSYLMAGVVDNVPDHSLGWRAGLGFTFSEQAFLSPAVFAEVRYQHIGVSGVPQNRVGFLVGLGF